MAAAASGTPGLSISKGIYQMRIDPGAADRIWSQRNNIKDKDMCVARGQHVFDDYGRAAAPYTLRRIEGGACPTTDPTSVPIRLASPESRFRAPAEDSLTVGFMDVPSSHSAAAPIFASAFASAIFCAKSFVFSTNFFAVAAFFVSGAPPAPRLGVFFSA